MHNPGGGPACILKASLRQFGGRMSRAGASGAGHADGQSFGNVLRLRRVAAQLTQEELADRAGLSVRSIVNIEGGQVRRPRRPSVQSLADALSIRGSERERFERAGRSGYWQAPADQPGRGDDGPGQPHLRAAGPPGSPLGVCQLPRDIADFTGRAGELAALTAATTVTAEHTATPVVTICGPGGVGKTALAVHTAHLLRQQFPDGQLYLDLHGTQADPLQPADALQRLLGALGDPPAPPRTGLAEKVERYRLMLSCRRILVVLDDVQTAAQVRPLLPGNPACAVILTSRRRLPELAGASNVELGLLSDDEALDLLSNMIGASRVAADRDSAARLVRLAGRLPLAVRAAGARLAGRPHWPTSRLVARLQDPRYQLDELAAGDLSIRASLAPSYLALAPRVRRAFRLVGLLDTPHVDTRAAAALLDIAPNAAQDLLDNLIDVHLLDANQPDQYHMHSLTRLYARERANTEDTDADLHAALTRATRAGPQLRQQSRPQLPTATRLSNTDSPAAPCRARPAAS